MMTSNLANDMYYDNAINRSPGSLRGVQQNTLHRASSRQFDAHSALQSGMYSNEDLAARFDTNRYQDRMNATLGGGGGGGATNGASGFGGGYDLSAAQTWNQGGFGGNNTMAAYGLTGRMRNQNQNRGGRGGIPNTWLDHTPPLPGLPSFAGLGNEMGPPSSSMRPSGSPDPDDELIPTAIVIKNIPFAVKKEQLQEIMSNMGLPLPYAFNYHFDNGVFRGLAFANFTTPEETSCVITGLNHFEIHGRKLRVEYKKMLPLAERERIEREKRERRGQLEEQHRPMGPPSLQNQPSLTSLHSQLHASSPSPVSSRRPGNLGPPPPNSATMSSSDLDMNDPETLAFYGQLYVFKTDHTRQDMDFPPSLAPQQRRIIHALAHRLNLVHVSRGDGDDRRVWIHKNTSGGHLSPRVPQDPYGQNRRTLNRAATTDFAEWRGQGAAVGAGPGAGGDAGHPLRQQSSAFLAPNEVDGGPLSARDLRNTRSVTDMRSWTPSPSTSSASFGLAAPTTSRLQGLGDFPGTGLGLGNGLSAPGTSASLTPTASSHNLAGHAADTEGVLNGLGTISFGSAAPSRVTDSPRGLRNMFSWDRTNAESNPGTIGGHRSGSRPNDHGNGANGFDERPMRQPRGPLPERGQGFPTPGTLRNRPNGHVSRGSDDLSSQSALDTRSNE